MVSFYNQIILSGGLLSHSKTAFIPNHNYIGTGEVC